MNSISKIKYYFGQGFLVKQMKLNRIMFSTLRTAFSVSLSFL